MARKLEVTVESTCISSGYCRNHAPDVFGTGPARKSVVIADGPVEETPKLVEAFESCPVEAISAVDAETGEDVFP
jgi:ferredoxin